MARTRRRHPSLLAASCFSSLQVNLVGTSIRRSPPVRVTYSLFRVAMSCRLVGVGLVACMCCTALCTSLLGLMRRMCPTHVSLRALIAATRSKVLVLILASSCAVRPVMWDSIRLFAPFISSLHARSHPVPRPHSHTLASIRHQPCKF